MFTIAIIGRPNVGKSTLFNRLVGKKLALVDDRPGVTRGRREGDAHLLGLDFRVIDTAGYEDHDAQSLPGRMRQQTEAAVAQADVALFLVDARAGVVPLDEEIARWLRGSSTPVVLVANKAEGRAGEQGVLEALALGFGDPVQLSAEHGEGVADLFDALRPHIEREDEEVVEEDESEYDPQTAVLKDDKGAYVMVAQGGVAKKTPVTAGFTQGDQTQITGLAPGTEVVVQGQNGLADGAKIKVNRS